MRNNATPDIPNMCACTRIDTNVIFAMYHPAHHIRKSLTLRATITTTATTIIIIITRNSGKKFYENEDKYTSMPFDYRNQGKKEEKNK